MCSHITSQFTSIDSQILNHPSPLALPPCSMVISMFGCSTPEFLLVKQCQTYFQQLLFVTSLPHHFIIFPTPLINQMGRGQHWIPQSLASEYKTPQICGHFLLQFWLRKIHHLRAPGFHVASPWGCLVMAPRRSTTSTTCGLWPTSPRPTSRAPWKVIKGLF